MGNPYPCDQFCFNRIGRFDCGCAEGFLLDDVNRAQCNDINECLNVVAPCAANQQCVNFIGGYLCQDSANNNPFLLKADNPSLEEASALNGTGVEPAQEQKFITNSEELALFISMAAVILVLLIAIVVIVTVIRRIKGQVKKFGDDEKALPRVSIRGMSELGHDGSVNPAYRAGSSEDISQAAAAGETNA